MCTCIQSALPLHSPCRGVTAVMGQRVCSCATAVGAYGRAGARSRAQAGGSPEGLSVLFVWGPTVATVRWISAGLRETLCCVGVSSSE